MTARDYFRVLREGWIIIVTCTVLAVVGAATVTLTSEPVYEATSSLAVSTCVAVDNSSTCDPVAGMTFAIQRASIYSSTASSLPVLRRTLELTDVVSSRSTLQEHTTVAQIADSPVIDVSATWHDPKEAADIANSLSQALVEYAKESIDDFESEMTNVTFSIISEAAPPSDPIASAPRTIGLALTLGLLIGLALAFARYYFDTRLRDRKDVENQAGMSVLANIPLEATKYSDLSTFEAHPAADAFRQLRAAVMVRLANDGIRTLMVASPDNGSAAAQVARGLASALAETGARVAIVDLDFQSADRSSAAESSVGIADILHGSADLDSVVRVVDNSTLLAIAAGSSTANRARSLGSNELPEVLSELHQKIDILVFNTAPILSGADSLSAARVADGVLLVVELGASKREHLRESIRSLGLAGTKPIGVATLTPFAGNRRRQYNQK